MTYPGTPDPFEGMGVIVWLVSALALGFMLLAWIMMAG